MKRLLIVLAVAALAGCATVAKVERGEQVVAERMVVQLEGPWNRFENIPQFPRPTWTVEGMTIDLLVFFVGVKDNEELRAQAVQGSNQKRPTFRSSMQPHEVVALFEAALTADGSTFQLGKLDRVRFLEGDGFRFEFTRVRREDDVQLSGFGYGTVRNGELHAIVYQAPRLAFYPRYAPQIEKMAQSARLRG
jgi:hypothetical protein